MALIAANDQNFQALLETHDQVLIKFYADWCGNCKLIAPKIRRMSEDPVYSHLTILDINAEENPNIRKLAGVDNLPYFALFHKGELVAGSAASKIEFVQQLVNQKLPA